MVPEAGHDATHLEGVEQANGFQALAEAFQQVSTQGHQAGGVVHVARERRDTDAVGLPPLLESSADGGFFGDQTGIGFDGRLEGLPFVECWREVVILASWVIGALHQQIHRVQAVGAE
ncbi:hypothetical protein D3C73_966340 [compost metagenome]